MFFGDPDNAKYNSGKLLKDIFNEFKNCLKESYSRIKTGKFGANMSVSLVNEGPITYWFEA